MEWVYIELEWFKRFIARLKELDESQHHDRGTGPYIPDRMIREACILTGEITEFNDEDFK